MELFPFRPDWAGRVLERLEWRTDVIESHDWTEERIPLRTKPRRYLEYNFLSFPGKPSVVDSLLWKWQAQQMLLPIWTDPQKVTTALAIDDTFIACEPSGFDFEDGGKAVVYVDDETYEIVDIATVDAGGLTLSAGVQRAWAAGFVLYPVRKARLEDNVSVQYITAGVARMLMRWEIEPSDYPAGVAAEQYLSTDVFNRRPNWVSNLPRTYLRKTQRLDYDTGEVEVDDHAEIPTTLRAYRTLLRNRQEIADWRGFLFARQGRYSRVWTLSWTQDLFQAASIGASDVVLTVLPLDSATRYAYQDGRRDIAIRKRGDGQWHFRRIQSIDTAGSGLEEITLDSPLGFSAEEGELDFICWLSLSRLDADAVEISWLSSGVAETELRFRSVRA